MTKKQENQEERLASFKTMSALSGQEVAIKDVCNDWILLTYDLPTTDEGNKARSEFLKNAARIGAVQHTESVYLLPWTTEAEMLALDISKAGRAYVWISTVKDEEVAKELTTGYDRDISEMLDDMKDRIVKIEEHANAGEGGIVERMREKTEETFASLSDVVTRRGSEQLATRLKGLRTWYDSIQVKGDAITKELQEILAEV